MTGGAREPEFAREREIERTRRECECEREREIVPAVMYIFVDAMALGAGSDQALVCLCRQGEWESLFKRRGDTMSGAKER